MTSLKRTACCIASTIAVTMVCSSANASLIPVLTSWDTSTAIAGGAGQACSMEDTEFLAVGGQLSVIFDTMGISLPSGPPGAKTRTTSCTVSIKSTFDQPGVLQFLHASLWWGWAKVGSAGGQVKMRGKICNSPYSTTTDSVGGTTTDPLHQTEQWISNITVPAVRECLFISHIGLSAWTGDANSTISLAIAGEDIELDVFGFEQN